MFVACHAPMEQFQGRLPTNLIITRKATAQMLTGNPSGLSAQNSRHLERTPAIRQHRPTPAARVPAGFSGLKECRACGEVQALPAPHAGYDRKCGRCGETLGSGLVHLEFTFPLLLAITITFITVLSLPLLQIELQGQHAEAGLMTGVSGFLHYGNWPMALFTFAGVVFAPFGRGGDPAVRDGLRRNRPAAETSGQAVPVFRDAAPLGHARRVPGRRADLDHQAARPRAGRDGAGPVGADGAGLEPGPVRLVFRSPPLLGLHRKPD